MYKKLIIKLTLCSVCFVFSGYSQTFNVASPMGITGEITGTLFNSPDFFAGGALYIPLIPLKGLSAYSGFIMRTGKKTVLVKKENTLYTQYRERRFLLDLGIDESVTFCRWFGVYARGGIGFTNAWYAGSSIKAKTGFTPSLQSGLLFVISSGQNNAQSRLRIGYTYAKMFSTGPHGVSLAWQLGIKG